jgi:methylglutaconyl-CoA hydratase
MPDATIRTEINSSGLAVVTLNRPKVHNAFNDALVGELTSTLKKLAADDSLRAVVLAGEGRSFCAGADLEWMRRAAAYSPEQNFEDALALAELLGLLDTLPKPTIAAVQGAAYGGGAGLVACCDIAIASEQAVFAFSEVRLGLIPAAISPYVITAIGVRQARRYFLSGERFDAVEARRIGLVHEVVPADSLQKTIEVTAAELTRGGPKAIRAAKDLIRAVSRRLDDETLPAETARRIAEIRAGEEARQGIKAFLEKQEP